jgi:hypothetical protein
MAELARLTVVRNAIEAEIVCGLLREEEIRCFERITNVGYGAGGEVPTSGGGAREVVVRSEDLERAREVLADRPELP